MCEGGWLLPPASLVVAPRWQQLCAQVCCGDASSAGLIHAFGSLFWGFGLASKGKSMPGTWCGQKWGLECANFRHVIGGFCWFPNSFGLRHSLRAGALCSRLKTGVTGTNLAAVARSSLQLGLMGVYSGQFHHCWFFFFPRPSSFSCYLLQLKILEADLSTVL